MEPNSCNDTIMEAEFLSDNRLSTRNNARLITYWTDSDVSELPSDPEIEEANEVKSNQSSNSDQAAKGKVRQMLEQRTKTYRSSVKRRKHNLTASSGTESEQNTEAKVMDMVLRKPSCPIEALPIELLQKIAYEAQNDADLRSLMASSPILAGVLHSNKSDFWRKRFLARYDYPIIDDILEFAVAYQLRSFVLRNFASRRAFKDGQTMAQLETIKDMVLEAYNLPLNNAPLPSYSRNLALMSNPSSSPWILNFFSTPLPQHISVEFDRTKVLFESLQLVLSHLVLSPASKIVDYVKTSRENYDISRVYNFNRPLVTLYTEDTIDEDEDFIAAASHRTTSLDLRSHRPNSSRRKTALDTMSLLHIRNFWHRHLTEILDPFREHTYSLMARSLMDLNMSPRCWKSQLQEHTDLGHKWVGTYGWISPWPKHLSQLEDLQCSADPEDPTNASVLDLVQSSDNKRDCFWPPEFASIPAFRDTVPDENELRQYKTIYIRGICNLIKLEAGEEAEAPSLPWRSQGIPKYHPYLGCRVRGLIHDISPPAFQDSKSPKSMKRKRRRPGMSDNERSEQDVGIPGWKRIVMIKYHPTTQYLLQVLEHAEEDYGGAFGAEITAMHNTANIWNDADESNGGTGEANDSAEDTSASSETSSMPLTDEEREQHLRTILARRLRSFTEKYQKLISTTSSKSSSSKLPALFSPAHIIALEDSFSPPAYISWDDGLSISNAYAYEGIIIPGGKIAMGRWWRCHGMDGLGPGKEVGMDGVGVEVRPTRSEDTGRRNDATGKPNMRTGDDKFEIVTNVTGTGEVIGSGGFGTGGSKGLERGPFVFWAV